MVVTRGEGMWGKDEEGQSGQIYGNRKRVDFCSTVHIQMMYYMIVHLKVMSLTNVTTINLIFKKEAVQAERDTHKCLFQLPN